MTTDAFTSSSVRRVEGNREGARRSFIATPERRWIVLAIVLAFAGCGRDRAPIASGPERAKPVPAPVATGSGNGSAGVGSGSAAGDDPWAEPSADDEPPDAAQTRTLADQACPTVKAPYYWRVAKAGKVSYLLGTRHLGVPLTKMPAKVTDQIKRSSLVVFETPPGDEDVGAVARKAEKPISELLGPQLWAKYKTLVGARTAKMVEHGSIAVALLTLMMMYEDKLSALDHEIQQLVQGAKIKTGGLESSAFQDKLLAELLDLKMLKATVMGTPDRKSLESESLKDLKEYCEGTDNDPGMDESARKVLKAGGYSDAEIKALDDKLLDERNQRWMPQLETLFAKGNVFVVVGADHLIGDRGVIKMLAAKGWQTTRVAP
jgi:hypothetical protein